MAQQRGSVTSIMFDYEDTYRTLNDLADRAPINMPFNAFNLEYSQPLNKPDTIRGDRNPTEPFLGFKDVKGTITVPVDVENIGYWLKAFFGDATESLVPASNRDQGGTVTIDASGDTDWSTPQTTTEVGDRVNFTDSNGLVQNGFVTARVDDSNMTVKKNYDGATNIDTAVTAATINYIVENLASAAGTTIDISSGVLTFNTSQGSAAAGQRVQYDTTKVCYLVSNVSGDDWNVVNADGFAPDDESGVDLESLEARPSYFQHIWTIGAQTAIPSFFIQAAFPDVSEFIQYYGLKANSIEFGFGGDGQLVASIDVIGSYSTNLATYDTNGVVITNTIDYFRHDQVSWDEGGSGVNHVKEASIRLNNQLDGGSITMDGTAARRDIPAGIAQVSGNLNALFEDDNIFDKALNFTESSITCTVTHTTTTRLLKFEMNEVHYMPKTPTIPGPQGVMYDGTWEAGYDDHADATAVKVTLRNDVPSY